MQTKVKQRLNMHANYMDATHCYEHTTLTKHPVHTAQTGSFLIMQKRMFVRYSVKSAVFQSTPSSSIIDIMYHYRRKTNLTEN